MNAQSEMVVSLLLQWVANKTENMTNKVRWSLNETTVHLPVSLPSIKKIGLYMIHLSKKSYEARRMLRIT